MITNGFTYGISDAVSLDVEFLPSSYIYVYTTAGDIVYLNTNDQIQYLPNAGLGYHPMSAKKILSSGIAHGTYQTTTAAGLAYCSSTKVG